MNARTRNITNSLDIATTSDYIDNSKIHSFLFKSKSNKSVISKNVIKPKTIDVSDFDYKKLVNYSVKTRKRNDIVNRMQVKKEDTITKNIKIQKDNLNLLSIENSHSFDKKFHNKSTSIMKNLIINPKAKESKFPILRNTKDGLEDSQNTITPFSNEYFQNILKSCNEKTKKITIKGLDPNKKVIDNLINSNGYLFLNHNSVFVTGEEIDSPRKRAKKKTVKQQQMNLIFKNYSKKPSVSPSHNINEQRSSSVFERKSGSKEKLMKSFLNLNKTIVDHNNNIKIKFYKSHVDEDITTKDIMTESIAKNYLKMTVNKSKYKMLQDDKSYLRFKSLESKLPVILNTKEKKDYLMNKTGKKEIIARVRSLLQK